MSEKFLLLALFFFGVLLFGVLNQKGGGRFNFYTPLDSLVPFAPVFSIPYLLLFPYIAFAGVVLFRTEYASPYYASMAFAMCSAAVVWFLFPSKMARPPVSKKKFFEKIVFKIYEGDSHANAFPSSHVFTSLITTYFLALEYPAAALPLAVLGASVAASTVLIKQHFAVDVVAGAVWAYAGIGVALIFFA